MLSKLLYTFFASIALISLAIFIAYPLFKSEEEPAPTEQVVVVPPTSLQPLPVEVYQEPVEIPEEVVVEAPKVQNENIARAEVERKTRLFVERFGSYSNHSNFENIKTLQSFMTPSMQKYAQGFIDDSANTSAVDYYGKNTRLVSMKISSFTNLEKATVGVVVREELQNGLNSPIETKFRDVRVEMVHFDGEWLIDGVFYK